MPSPQVFAAEPVGNVGISCAHPLTTINVNHLKRMSHLRDIDKLEFVLVDECV